MPNCACASCRLSILALPERKWLLNHVRLIVTLWTVATRLLCPWDFLSKSTGVGCHFLLQEIFLTQGSKPGLLRCKQMLYPLNHQGSTSIANPHLMGMG